ncbi:hypothetical protein O7598_02795 [Micromonospora sp. WMMC241]|uniref:hypothetical protein n=1 Tax=Micromonospora sp. WMMC241 TaxID=3015159 RepID=UPI0022B6239B|nr:hypothetical protein [Micromonospora sp. WMMC241]MCZ7435311.1 hypothetical protein [Micromonospora sp. WMMC241]
MAELRSGALLLISRAASVQFGKPFHFRLIRVLDWTTYDGWTWLDGYQLDERGEAVARRSIFVMRRGLRPGSVPPARGSQTRRRSRRRTLEEQR